MECRQGVRQARRQHAAVGGIGVVLPAFAAPRVRARSGHLLHHQEGRAQDPGIVLEPVGAWRRQRRRFEALQDSFGGFLEVQPSVVTILTDTALHADDIDEATALEAQEQAERRLSDQAADFNFADHGAVGRGGGEAEDVGGIAKAAAVAATTLGFTWQPSAYPCQGSLVVQSRSIATVEVVSCQMQPA